jgi:hypothetical protein
MTCGLLLQSNYVKLRPLEQEVFDCASELYFPAEVLHLDVILGNAMRNL